MILPYVCKTQNHFIMALVQNEYFLVCVIAKIWKAYYREIRDNTIVSPDF